MSYYSVSQLMRTQFPQMQGLRAKLDTNPASTRNAAAAKLWRTEGGATVNDFFVAPRSSINTHFARRSSKSPSRSQPSVMKSE